MQASTYSNLDGAMGYQYHDPKHKLEEEDFRGERFADWAFDIKR